MIKLRASYAPAAMHCIHALDELDHPAISHETEAAQAGTFVHNCLAEWIGSQKYDEPKWRSEAKSWGLKEDDMMTLIDTGIAMWDDKDGGLNIAHGDKLTYEEKLDIVFGSEVRLTGTADLMSYNEKEKRIVIDDWKTGQVRPEAFHQLRQYAVLGLQLWPDAEKVLVRLVWLRDGWTDEIEYEAEDVLGFQSEILKHLSQDRSEAEYRTGAHCKYCKRKHHCVAWESTTASLVRIAHQGEMENTLEGGVRALYERGELGKAHEMLGQLKDLIDNFRAAERLLVEEVGPISVGDGKVLAITEVKYTEIDAAEGLQMAYKELGADAYKAAKIGKGELEKLIKAAARKGKKGVAWDSFMDQMETAGILSHTTSTQLRIKKG